MYSLKGLTKMKEPYEAEDLIDRFIEKQEEAQARRNQEEHKKTICFLLILLGVAIVSVIVVSALLAPYL